MIMDDCVSLGKMHLNLRAAAIGIGSTEPGQCAVMVQSKVSLQAACVLMDCMQLDLQATAIEIGSAKPGHETV